jgi:hypothetical protein
MVLNLKTAKALGLAVPHRQLHGEVARLLAA